MRSIKMGIIAIFALQFGMECFRKLPPGPDWTYVDYANSICGLVTILVAIVCIALCCFIPVRKAESEDGKETPE